MINFLLFSSLSLWFLGGINSLHTANHVAASNSFEKHAIEQQQESQTISKKHRSLGIQKRIIGGTDSTPTRYNYFTMVESFDEKGRDFICGGTLIATDFVLTAGHCKSTHSTQSSRVQVNHTTFDSRLNLYSYRRDVAKQYLHPEYKTRPLRNDIMLMQLLQPVTAPIELARLNFDNQRPQQGQTLGIIGTGFLDRAQTQVPDHLQETQVSLDNFTACRNTWKQRKVFLRQEWHLCASDDGRDTCVGDSGGPLFIKGDSDETDLQVGVTSFGSFCDDRNYPTIYTNVSRYTDWLHEIVCANSIDPPLTFKCNTLVPSATPTNMPSLQPSTSSPSQTPSSFPTASPSFSPSANPSTIPTLGSTTLVPSTSMQPSAPPTNSLGFLENRIEVSTSVLATCDVTTVRATDPCDDFAECSFPTLDGQQQSCIWLATRPQEQATYCRADSDAYYICPETCGLCRDDCQDDRQASFTFRNAVRDCFWLSLRPHLVPEICTTDETARTQCRETCDNCRGNDAGLMIPSPFVAPGAPSPEPTTASPTMPFPSTMPSQLPTTRPSTQPSSSPSDRPSRVTSSQPSTSLLSIDDENPTQAPSASPVRPPSIPTQSPTNDLGFSLDRIEVPQSVLDKCDLTLKPTDPCDDHRDCAFQVVTDSTVARSDSTTPLASVSSTESQQCIWLASRPEQHAIQCVPSAEAYYICPETCGVCQDDCRDDRQASFMFRNVVRDCFWLSLRPHLVSEICATDEIARTQCRETCDNCRPPPAGEITSPFVQPGAPSLAPTTAQPVAPSFAPSSLSSPSPPQSLFCFSDRTIVTSKRLGESSIRDLRVGDQVLGKGGEYERIYSFGHYDDTIQAKFIQLWPFGLEVSPQHMVLVKQQQSAKEVMMPASSIRVGDVLSNGKAVTRISTVVRKGVYNPFTTSGTIVVNQVVASNYVSLQGTPKLYIEYPTNRRKTNGNVVHWTTPFTHHWLSHAVQTPHRLWRLVLWGGQDAMVTVTCPQQQQHCVSGSMSEWSHTLYQWGQWFLLILNRHYPCWVQLGILLPAILILASFIVLESTILFLFVENKVGCLVLLVTMFLFVSNKGKRKEKNIIWQPTCFKGKRDPFNDK